MAHNPNLPPQPHCFPLEWIGRLTCQSSLGWFGVSTHSDVAKGVEGNTCVTVKRIRPRERPEFSEIDLELPLKRWEKVSSHPNIQKFLGLWKANSWDFPLALVTPYREWNLMDYIGENPSVDKIALAYQVASGLEYMHSQDPPITHGNVKGSNILVDGDGTVYLTDIGICEALSIPGRLGGELRWSAPEKVLDGQPHTPACDVWSFAMTILEMYTHYPFQNHTQGKFIVLAMGRGDVPPRPTMIEESVWILLLECWNYQPSQRPSMAAILPRLSKDQAGCPVSRL